MIADVPLQPWRNQCRRAAFAFVDNLYSSICANAAPLLTNDPATQRQGQYGVYGVRHAMDDSIGLTIDVPWHAVCL
jgi:hypothetical protein